jgi:hypothetical protein
VFATKSVRPQLIRDQPRVIDVVAGDPNDPNIDSRQS